MTFQSWRAVWIATVLSLGACSEDLEPNPQVDAAPDAGMDGTTTDPDGHVVDDGKGSDDALADRVSRDENVQDDVRQNDVPVGDREPDGVTSDHSVDHDIPNDVTIDRDRAALPDGRPISCEVPRQQGRFSFQATLPDGSMDRCGSLGADSGTNPPFGHRTASGVVRSMTTSAPNNYVVTIDTCTGDGCAAQNVVLEVTSTTPLVLPVGAFVEADYWILQSRACSYFLRLSNLPAFNGQTNPISDKNKIDFLASDGLFDSSAQMAAVGVTATPKPLGCVQEAGIVLPVPADTYVFKFSHNGDDLFVPMGESSPWTINGQNILIRNLRSYQVDGYDAYWDWAFTFEER